MAVIFLNEDLARRIALGCDEVHIDGHFASRPKTPDAAQILVVSGIRSNRVIIIITVE